MQSFRIRPRVSLWLILLRNIQLRQGKWNRWGMRHSQTWHQELDKVCQGILRPEDHNLNKEGTKTKNWSSPGRGCTVTPDAMISLGICIAIKRMIQRVQWMKSLQVAEEWAQAGVRLSIPLSRPLNNKQRITKCLIMVKYWIFQRDTNQPRLIMVTEQEAGIDQLNTRMIAPSHLMKFRISGREPLKAMTMTTCIISIHLIQRHIINPGNRLFKEGKITDMKTIWYVGQLLARQADRIKYSVKYLTRLLQVAPRILIWHWVPRRGKLF